MPGELGRGGQQAERIDWRKSVLLNLVVQATYCLTVATCRYVAICSLYMGFELCSGFRLEAIPSSEVAQWCYDSIMGWR